MAQVSEPRSPASTQPAQPNVQDVFLNHARRDRVAVTITLLDGRQFDGQIKNFDRFAVIADVNGTDQLIFKHAIATISTPRAVANYFASHHS